MEGRDVLGTGTHQRVPACWESGTVEKPLQARPHLALRAPLSKEQESEDVLVILSTTLTIIIRTACRRRLGRAQQAQEPQAISTGAMSEASEQIKLESDEAWETRVSRLSHVER